MRIPVEYVRGQRVVFCVQEMIQRYSDFSDDIEYYVYPSYAFWDLHHFWGRVH